MAENAFPKKSIVKENTQAFSKPRLFKSKKFRDYFGRTIATLATVFGAMIIMIPVIWMFSTSLKNKANVASMPPRFIPAEGGHIVIDGTDYFLYDVTFADGSVKTLAMVKLDPTNSQFIDPENPSVVIDGIPSANTKQHFIVKLHWENYVDVWSSALVSFSKFMMNTAMYATLAVIGEVLSCSFVAFGFARLRGPGKNLLFLLVLATLMLPYAVVMIPSYVMFTNYIPKILSFIGLQVQGADRWWPLILPKFFGSAYLIFLVRQFYMGISKEYDDAARIDGAGYFRIWWNIILPMSRPVLVAIAILSFMYHWNDYMGPLIYLNTPARLPISVGLQSFSSTYNPSTNLLMGGAVISVLPLLVIFFLLNRYFIQGVVVSGIKG